MSAAGRSAPSTQCIGTVDVVRIGFSLRTDMMATETTKAAYPATAGTTDPEFPFGFMQLSTWADSQNSTCVTDSGFGFDRFQNFADFSAPHRSAHRPGAHGA